MTDANTKVMHLPEQQQFLIELEGENAILEYEMGKDDTLMVTHTEVPPAHEGKGYASQMAKEVMAYARIKELKVMPLCTYMATFLSRKQEEYRDLFSPEFKPE